MIRADRILVLDLGTIVEGGKHEDIVRRAGLDASLFRLQVGAAEVPALGA